MCYRAASQESVKELAVFRIVGRAPREFFHRPQREWTFLKGLSAEEFALCHNFRRPRQKDIVLKP